MENMLAGIMVAVIGISVVFAFLLLLVGAMTAMSGIMAYINKIFPEAVSANGMQVKPAVASKEDEIAVAVLSAILKNGSLK